MKTSEAEILIVPGWSSSGPDHWQSRWERNLPTARRVEQQDWLHPERDAWVEALVAATLARAPDKPVVFLAHSLGVATVVHAAARLPPGSVAGAFLVGPADVDNADRWPVTQGYTFDKTHNGFAPLPLRALPFPSLMIASANDPYCAFDRAEALSAAWGSTLVAAGAAGHLNVASGHGPWPEGLMRLGWFLKRIGEAQ